MSHSISWSCKESNMFRSISIFHKEFTMFRSTLWMFFVCVISAALFMLNAPVCGQEVELENIEDDWKTAVEDDWETDSTEYQYNAEMQRREEFKAVAGAAAGTVGAYARAEAGAFTGVAVGGAIGSAVPVVGTAVGAAVGGFIGGIIGGYTGYFFGKTASDAVIDYTW